MTAVLKVPLSAEDLDKDIPCEFWRIGLDRSRNGRSWCTECWNPPAIIKES